MNNEELKQKLTELQSERDGITQHLNSVNTKISCVKYEIWCNERNIKMGDTITLKNGKQVKLCGFDSYWAKAYIIKKDGSLGRMATVYDSDFPKPTV